MVDTRTLLLHSLASLAKRGTSEPDSRARINKDFLCRIADRLSDARRSRAQLLIEHQLLGRGPGLDSLIQHQVGATAFHR